MRQRRIKQKFITDLAKGQPCLIRLPGICCADPATTVPCHYRMHGLSGMSFIPEPLWIAFGCVRCHSAVDTDKSDEVQLAFAKAVFRTQAWLLKQGYIAI